MLFLFSCFISFLCRTSRLPVIYVFGKKPVDLDYALSIILQVFDSTSKNDEEWSNQSVLLKSDVMYSHLMGTIPSLMFGRRDVDVFL